MYLIIAIAISALVILIMGFLGIRIFIFKKEPKGNIPTASGKNIKKIPVAVIKQTNVKQPAA